MLRRATIKPNADPIQKAKTRDAGILLHITSLPSGFGIGDIGPEAKSFIDFLSRCKHRYWQLLPLNPVGAEQKYSPYSSTSSMAGNPLLISPELLAADGLLSSSEIKKHYVNPGHKVDFDAASEVRKLLLQRAANKYFQKKNLHRFFRGFCQRESYWLDDYALYQAIKYYYHNQPWFVWPMELRMRSYDALKNFEKNAVDMIRYVKWEQFTFFTQWQRLRTYANNAGVNLFGDLPFYVSYDSVDVWANRKIFNVDKTGAMTGVAGVPPDYFNSNGQLWGMPTFKWDTLKSMKYDWWIKRLRKNMQLFDLLRLDHFRAFADYWEVPAGETTAVHGQWKPGPGRSFFMAARSALGELKFVAEDLGDVNTGVFQLRDDFNLPGMKILQFAFGTGMAVSDYIPHNYTRDCIAYTGTHDNNTTVGWFSNDLPSGARKQVAAYLGKQVDKKNVHIELSRLAYASVARTAILPLQDVLGLDEQARMNIPASTEDNWGWRFRKSALTKSIENRLREWVALYNR